MRRLIIPIHVMDFSMEVRDAKPSFMDIDSRSHLMNKIETEDFTKEDSSSKNQIMGQSICLSCENQWNTTKENNITSKSQNNDTECNPPYSCMCGPLLNSSVDKVEKINQIAIPSPKIDFDPNFNQRFWNSENINQLDLSIILKDDTAKAIYDRGVHDGTEVASKNEANKNEFDAKDALRRHNLTLIKNHILKKKKKYSETTKMENDNELKKKLFEVNNTSKLSTVTADDTFQQQFSIFDNIDASYLPLPAMQLMLNTVLSNDNQELFKVYNNDQVIKDNKFRQRKKNKQSKYIIKNARPHQICKKNIHTKKYAYAMDHQMQTADSVKITNIYSVYRKNVQTWTTVKNIKLTPIIPLSVIYYMDELESTKNVNNVDINNI
ncbi:uncharacterized protein LOC112694422 isoform X2 [Sipha flava]|uniref:Uncharacterized protein LOC112694422 isoform X2 n=1 Tax=Sipha flava TaxID=143950 RepID=A0A8B8GSP7_9HEMI|nr:uncharacterized protein LOC112694422 isoform X2 [Sipha flava]